MNVELTVWSATQLTPPETFGPVLFWFGKWDKIYPTAYPLMMPRISVASTPCTSFDHFCSTYITTNPIWAALFKGFLIS